MRPLVKVFIVNEVQGARRAKAEIVWSIQRGCEHRVTQQLVARNIFTKASL